MAAVESTHNTPEADKEKQKVALSSVGAAILLTAMKIIVGVITGSLGILSEAAHSALDLVAAAPRFNLYGEKWAFFNCPLHFPPAKFVFDDPDRRGMAIDSMVSGGDIVSGATVRRSLLFSNVYVHSYAEVSDSVLLPDVDVGRGARLSRVVVDKGCKIPEGLVAGEDPEEDAKRFHVTKKGITLITPEMLGQQLHHFR